MELIVGVLGFLRQTSILELRRVGKFLTGLLGLWPSCNIDAFRNIQSTTSSSPSMNVENKKLCPTLWYVFLSRFQLFAVLERILAIFPNIQGTRDGEKKECSADARSRVSKAHFLSCSSPFPSHPPEIEALPLPAKRRLV